jgi:hypothetical protein
VLLRVEAAEGAAAEGMRARGVSQSGRQAVNQSGRQAGSQSVSQAGRQSISQSGRQAVNQSGRQAGCAARSPAILPCFRLSQWGSMHPNNHMLPPPLLPSLLRCGVPIYGRMVEQVLPMRPVCSWPTSQGCHH